MLDLTIIQFNGENRIDSRLVAKALGIEHKSFMETIRKYQDRLERRGSLPFQTAVTKRAIGASTSTYTLLNEGQALFASTLSRNTDEVVDFKDALVTAFLDARKTQSLPQEDINEVHRRRRDANVWLIEKMRFTVDEKTNIIALTGILKGLNFADNAFLDTSLGITFNPWCEEQGYDMSLVKKSKKPHLVGYELNADGMPDWDRPIWIKVHSYPEDPFGLAWTKFLVEYYWPEKFLPYITRKYKCEERVDNIASGIKVIGFFTGLSEKQITEKSKKGRK